MFNIGNFNKDNGLIYMAMESDTNKMRVLRWYSMNDMTLEETLSYLNLSREDFTESDWNHITTVCE